MEQRPLVDEKTATKILKWAKRQYKKLDSDTFGGDWFNAYPDDLRFDVNLYTESETGDVRCVLYEHDADNPFDRCQVLGYVGKDTDYLNSPAHTEFLDLLKSIARDRKQVR